MSQASQKVDLPIGELFSQAWRLFTENVGILIGATVLFGVILSVGNSVSYGLVGIAVTGPLALGFATVALKIVKGEKPEFSVFFSGFQRFLPAFLANLLITVFTMLGVFLCLVGSLFVAMIYMLTYFYMHDKNLDFWDAMEASRETVMNNLGSWIVVALVLAGINIVGAIPCGIGLLVTTPLTALVLALAYEKVEGAVGAAAMAGGTGQEM